MLGYNQARQLGAFVARRLMATHAERPLTVAVAVNGQAVDMAITSKDFLSVFPSGAYTTVRTTGGGTRLFEWTAHVERTAKSAGKILAGQLRESTVQSQNVVQTLSTPHSLRKVLDKTVCSAMQHFHCQFPDALDSELRITALVSLDPDTQQPCIAAHVAPLPPLPQPPVRVEVRGHPRKDASSKTSSWVTERAPLEKIMQQADVGAGGVNEFLLSVKEDKGGVTKQAIYEGGQTNFYAIVDGCVHTAPDGTVLEGTVRRLTFEVCEQIGIKVVKEAPDLLQAAEKWEGALISSTSRLLLPIDELYVPADGSPSSHDDLLCRFDNSSADSLSVALASAVAAAVEEHSEPIPGLKNCHTCDCPGKIDCTPQAGDDEEAADIENTATEDASQQESVAM